MMYGPSDLSPFTPLIQNWRWKEVLSLFKVQPPAFEIKSAKCSQLLSINLKCKWKGSCHFDILCKIKYLKFSQFGSCFSVLGKKGILGKSIDFCYWIPASARWIALGEKSWNGQHNETVLLMLQIKKKKPEYGSVIKLCICLRYWGKMESYLWMLLYLGLSSTSPPFPIFYSPQEETKLLLSVLIKRSQKSKHELQIWFFFSELLFKNQKLFQKSRFHSNQCVSVIIFFWWAGSVMVLPE